MVQRRWSQLDRKRLRAERRGAKSTGKVMTLTRGGKSYKLWCWPGKMRNCMAENKPYESQLLYHLETLGLTGTAVDVGANLGNHTMWFAVMMELDVVAFEPVWTATLRNNVELNGLDDRVRVEPYGLSDVEGKAGHLGLGRLEPGIGKLETRTLDSYGLTDVCLIKIDVEGMEPHVLRGARATIARCRPVITAEAWDSDYHQAIANILEPLGYRQAETIGKRGWAPNELWIPGEAP